MKMKTFIFLLALLVSQTVWAQALVGKWQLMKQTSCIESELDNPNQSEDMDELMAELNSRKNRTADVIQFKTNYKGEQSTSILGKRKDVNDKNFVYTITDKQLDILDPKSKTIIQSYIIEELTVSEMILADANRTCDKKYFKKLPQ